MSCGAYSLSHGRLQVRHGLLGEGACGDQELRPDAVDGTVLTRTPHHHCDQEGLRGCATSMNAIPDMRTELECLAKAAEMEVCASGCKSPRQSADFLYMARCWRFVADQAAWQDAHASMGRAST